MDYVAFNQPFVCKQIVTLNHRLLQIWHILFPYGINKLHGHSFIGGDEEDRKHVSSSWSLNFMF